MIALSSKAKLPKAKRKASMPDSVANAIKDYKRAYLSVYKTPCHIAYTQPFVYVNAGDGVKIKRLKELTKMLKDKLKDSL